MTTNAADVLAEALIGTYGHYEDERDIAAIRAATRGWLRHGRYLSGVHRRVSACQGPRWTLTLPR